MYLAFLLIVLAVAIAANTAWLLLALAGFFAALHFGVVKREETVPFGQVRLGLRGLPLEGGALALTVR